MSLLMTLISKETYVQQCWEAGHNYIKGVKDGSIITNENIRLAVKRYEEDLLRTDLDFRLLPINKVFKFCYYVYTDKNKRFILEPFQAFIIFCLFGFYFKDTDIRKYLYAFLFIGRKNGKTTFAAVLQLYFMLCDDFTFPQSVLISGSQNQSNDTAFASLIQIVKSSPALNSRLETMRSNQVIYRDRSKYGFCKTVPAIPDRLEGLNPTSCILDEIHTYKDSQKFNVIKNALGTKSNPMLFLISTAGFGKDSFCAQLVETGRNILRGISNDDRFFYLLYELEEKDDINDEKTWYKANPGLGTILDYKLFKDQFNTNKSIPTLLNDFITKRFNLFLEEQGEWIPSRVILSNMKTFSEDDVKDLPCYVGVDLSETRDLTSIVCLWNGGDKYYIRSYFFFVEGENNVLRKGGINVLQWVREGYIIKCESSLIHPKLIKEYLFDIDKRYKIKGCYYDPWHFKSILVLSEGSKGGTLRSDDNSQSIWCVPVRPGVKSFDWPMRQIEQSLFENKINIYPNKCMLWNFQNVVATRDLNGNIRPDKKRSKDAIDGVIALHNAFYGLLGINANSAQLFIKSISN